MKFNYQESALKELGKLFTEIADKIAEITGETVQEAKELTLKLSSWDLVKNINIGWNLGNTLDSCVESAKRNIASVAGVETCWGNPQATKGLIDAVKAAGFNIVRVPVTWFYFTDNDDTLTVRADWMARVKEVVDYVIDNGMYCILNTHSDRPIIAAELGKSEYYCGQMVKLWSQIAEEFKEYDEKLIFEAYNEVLNVAQNWKGTSDTVAATNKLAQAFVDFIRTTGGNNYSRNIMVNTYAAGMQELIVSGFEVPKDKVKDRLIVSVHDYEMGIGADMETSLMRVANKFDGIVPVIIGEFGTQVCEMPAKSRNIHAQNLVSRAYAHGMKCIYWDNGFTDSYLSLGVITSWELIDRKTYEVMFPDLLKAMMDGAKGITVTDANAEKTTYDITDVNKIACGTWNTKTKTFTEGSYGSSVILKEPFPVTAGYDYKFTVKTADDGFRIPYIAFLDKDKQVIGTVAKTNPTLAFVNSTAPKGAKYLNVQIYNPWNSGVTLSQYGAMMSNEAMKIIVEETKKDVIDCVDIEDADFNTADNWKKGEYFLSDASYRNKDNSICATSYIASEGERMYHVDCTEGYVIDVISITNEMMAIGQNVGLQNGQMLTVTGTSYFAINLRAKDKNKTAEELLQGIENGSITVNVEKDKTVGDMKTITLSKTNNFVSSKCLNTSTGEVKELGRTDLNYCATKEPIDVSDRGSNYISIKSTYGEKRLCQLDENKKVIKYDSKYETIKKFNLEDNTKYIAFESTYVIDSDPVIINYFKKAESQNVSAAETKPEEKVEMVTILDTETQPSITDTFTITNSANTVESNVAYVENTLEIDNASGTGKSVTFLQMKQFKPKGKTAYEVTATLKDNIPTSKISPTMFNTRIGFDDGEKGIYATIAPKYGVRLFKGSQTGFDGTEGNECEVNDNEEFTVKLEMDYENLQDGGKLYFNGNLVKEIAESEFTVNSISQKNCPNITVTDAEVNIKEIKFYTSK